MRWGLWRFCEGCDRSEYSILLTPIEIDIANITFHT